jgi:ArsR family transcriptional regulator, arsenate/arsenite/antimonite-responsive transcriptional repressor
MSAALPTISPRSRQPGGCCTPLVEPAVDEATAAQLVRVAKALGDPVRLRIVDAIRRAAPEAVCQCELKPLFEISQPAVSKHLKVLVDAGVLAVERRGAWAYYYVPPDSTLEVLDAWLS